jgi:putative aldouronate transport system substrate-binding protein
MMQSMSRRQLLKLTGMTMTGALLAACGAQAPAAQQTSDSAQAPASEIPTVSMVESWFGVPQIPEVLAEQNTFISQRAQDSGLNLQFQSLLLDDHDTKYPVLYASGEKFTCAFDAPWIKMVDLIDQGYLVEIEELLPVHAPKIVETDGDDLLQANYFKEHLYGIPAYFYFNQTSGPEIREDLRLKYGVPEIGDTWESLEPYLQAIKENEPDMVPFAIDPNGAIIFNHNWLCVPSQNLNPGDVMVGSAVTDVWGTPTYTDYENIDVFVEIAELTRKWYELGYLSESFDEGQPFYVGKAGAKMNNEPDFKYWDTQKQLQANIPDGTVTGHDMSGMRAGLVQKERRLRQWNFVVFNKAAPEAEQIAGLEFFNWIYSDQENADAWLFGQEGVNYTRGAEEGTYEEVEGVEPARNYRRNWYVGGVPGKWERVSANLPQAARDTLNYLSNPENFLENPIETFVPDLTPVETQLAALKAADPEARFGLVSGQIDTAEALATHQQTLDAAGRQEVKAEFQAQLDAYLAAK